MRRSVAGANGFIIDFFRNRSGWFNELIDAHRVMVCSDGMATMTHRTTFALDSDTARRLKTLALRWQVSQAEVVRRALAQAERAPDAQQPDLHSRLKAYHAAASLKAPAADKYVAQTRSDRNRWRDK